MSFLLTGTVTDSMDEQFNALTAEELMQWRLASQETFARWPYALLPNADELLGVERVPLACADSVRHNATAIDFSVPTITFPTRIPSGSKP